MSDVLPGQYRGEGRGPITRDGCAVLLYLRSAYQGELELLAAHLPAGCSVLELGCGTGRLTRPLLARGCRVTAVDNSPDMLCHVPEGARKVHSDIESLQLAREFDVALFASCLVNNADDAMRRAQLAACRRHLRADGTLLFERFDPQWLLDVAVGPASAIGDIRVAIDAVRRQGDLVAISLRYTTDDEEWKQHFVARVLRDEDVDRELREAGLGPAQWINRRWGSAMLTRDIGPRPCPCAAGAGTAHSGH